MSKAKGKGGTGRGTDSKGWNRWKASATKGKNAPQPYPVSKATIKAEMAKAKAEKKAAADKTESKASMVDFGVKK